MEQENKNTIAEGVFKKLEEGQVKPIARWHFVLRNNTFWALWVLSVVLGACATAATIFVFLNSGWGYRAVTHDSFLSFLLDVVPFFWIVSIVVMIAFGYFNIRHTTRGYRFSFYLVVMSSIIVSFIGGTILYAVGIAGDIDEIRKPIPFADPLMHMQESRWNNEERGLVLGLVKNVDVKSKIFTLTTAKGQEKIFSTSELQDWDINFIKEGSVIRVIQWSDNNNPDIFVACAVIPGNFRLPQQKVENFERKIDITRINKCEGVRPYKRYQETLITN